MADHAPFPDRSSDSPSPSPISPVALSSLTASDTALRHVLAVFQCDLCAHILREPTTLPCGQSLCRRCLPPPHTRQLVSYPATVDRKAGVVCPFENCQKEHALFDCGLDYVLGNMVEAVKEGLKGAEVVHGGSWSEARDGETKLAHPDHGLVTTILVSPEPESSPGESQPRTFVVRGTRLQALFFLAEKHGLSRTAGLHISSQAPLLPSSLVPEPASRPTDSELLDAILACIRPEAECRVCYAIFLNPMTTPCGHTFCAICLHRVLDHTPHCPVCRRGVSIAPLLSPIVRPANHTLELILAAFWPESVAARRHAAAQEGWVAETASDSTAAQTAERVPIFRCSLTFPGIPNFLHIYEPCYRLMVRRCMEGDRVFGMVLGRWMGDNGAANGVDSEEFATYGTLQHISRVEYLPDGRSFIDTMSQGRFKIRSYTWEDGILMATIERLHDMGIADEEALETAELSAAAAQSYTALRFEDYFPTPNTSNVSSAAAQSSLSRANAALEAIRPRSPVSIPLADPFSDMPPPTLPAAPHPPRPHVSAMTTAELLGFARVFAMQLVASEGRSHEPAWPPPANAVLFVWWFAARMPMPDEKRYALLKSTSMRKRLTICCTWALEREGSRWSAPRCVVM
ncbi:hypothetical protein BROUX41_003872 [Berkeleyomyces rouxiae]|uniref:uncharacterized protein n=1 Tax=Berkeleyomyces rouxiae TaxID=2035830 RepID=UPI003B81F5D8